MVNTQLWKVDIENESEKHDNWFRETLKDKSINKNPVFVPDFPKKIGIVYPEFAG